MKKSIIKIMALVCCMAMALSGCGGNAKTSSMADDAKSTAPNSESKSEQTSNVNKEGDKIVNEKVTITAITAVNSFVKTPIGEFEAIKQLENTTNIHWEIQGISESTYTDKLTLLISSDSLPEVVLTVGGVDVKGKFYKDGQFMQIDNLIDEWAPGLKKIISDPLTKANLLSPDDNLYVTPAGEMAPWLEDYDEYFVNKEWLEKLNLEIPTTLDQFYEMLKAFKEKDPNGNKLKDEIPMTLNMKNGQLIRFMGLFGLPIDSNYEMQRNKKYIYGPTQPEFRKCLEYFHKLYAEGLLDPESLTQEKPEMMAKGAASPTILGTLVGFWANDFCPQEVSKKYVSIPPLKGGKEGEPEWLGAVVVPGPGMAITSKCKNPEAAIRWADYISADPKNALEVTFGPVGPDRPLALGSDGKYFENVEKTPEGLTFNEWSYSTAVRMSVPFCLLSSDVIKYRAIGGEIQQKLDLVAPYRPYFYAEPLTAAHINYYTNEDARQEVATIQADLKTIVQEFLAQSLMNGITDDSWNTFQNTLKKAKTEKLIEARQNSLDTYYSK